MIAAGAVVLPAPRGPAAQARPERSVPAIGAVVTGLALGGAMLGATDEWARGTRCPGGAVHKYLASLPKDSVIAGDPMDLKCVPATARPVVIST